MDETIHILFRLNILFIVLLGVYFIINSKITIISRRISLLILPIISFGSFLINKQLTRGNSNFDIPSFELDVFTIGTVNSNSVDSNLSIEWILSIGFLLFLFYSFYKVIRIIMFFKNGSYEINGKYKVLKTTDKDSFSFFNFIHLSSDLNKEQSKIVLEHEIIHSRKKHSLDIIYMEIIHALFWYNPFVFLLKKELVKVHELEVDKEMYEKHESNYLEHLLAFSLGANSSKLLLTSQFYNKLTLAKRTKTMINKTNKIKFLGIILPIAAISFALFSCTNSSGTILDEQDKESMTEISDSIYSEVDKHPEFKGGQKALMEYLGETIKYPEQAKKDSIQGKVFMSFVINKKGELEDITVLRGVPELNEEAIRAIKEMPNWIPGENDGKKVKVKFIIPINFKL